jgi:tetratricopeptide (TPR) repeat protein
MHAKSRAGKIFYGLAAAFTLMSIYFTATRGAMLALLLGGFIFSVIYLALIKTDTEKGKKHRKIGLYILGTLVAIPILFAIFRNTEFVSSSPVLGRFRNLSLDDARAYIWQMSFQGFKERPILGWGPENYGLVFSKYYRPELYAQEPWFDRAHNIVLDWLVNAGVPGLLSYLGIFVAAFYLLWLNWQKKKVTLEVGITLAILLVVYFLQNLFVFDNIATYISFFAILAYIYNMTVFEDPLANESGSSSGSRHSAYKPAIDIAYAPLAGVFLALPLFYTLYAGNWKPYAANIALLNGIKVRTIQEVDAGYDEFKKALEYNTLGNQEIREQYAKFAEIVVMTEGIPDAKKLEIFKMALQEIDKSIQENPLDSRPLLFFSALLIRANLPDQALAALNKALELSPQKQQVYFEIGDLYLKRADYPKAIEILEKAWKLEPKFRKALVNYLAALILGGENAKADTLITETWPTELDPEPLLLQVYQKVGDHRRLLPWLDVFVKSFPDNWTYRQDRAIALISLGRRAEAIRFIEDSIKQYPQFKSEGENFLRQIR